MCCMARVTGLAQRCGPRALGSKAKQRDDRHGTALTPKRVHVPLHHGPACHHCLTSVWRLQELTQHLARASDHQQEPAGQDNGGAELQSRPSGGPSTALDTAGRHDEQSIEHMQPQAPQQPQSLPGNALAVASSPRAGDQGTSSFSQPRQVAAAAQSFLDAGMAAGAQVHCCS